VTQNLFLCQFIISLRSPIHIAQVSGHDLLFSCLDSFLMLLLM
jgi:hypothetical protein